MWIRKAMRIIEISFLQTIFHESGEMHDVEMQCLSE